MTVYSDRAITIGTRTSSRVRKQTSRPKPGGFVLSEADGRYAGTFNTGVTPVIAAARHDASQYEEETPLKRITLTKWAFLSAAVLVALGCATILNDTSPPVSIGSQPSGADVYVDGNLVGRTPAVIELSTKSHHTVVFRKEGYADRTYLLQTHTGALWVVLDVLTGLIPIIIDIATGDWQELNEDNINVVLQADSS